MTQGSRISNQSGLIWLTVAIIMSFGVLTVNGAPLVYYDSFYYDEQGDKILERVFPSARDTGPAATQHDRGEGDEVVTVSRSPVYSLIMSLSWHATPPYAVAVLHAAAVLFSAWLVATAASAAAGGSGFDLTLIAAPVAVAALGALPFYVAYMMPDIFAAVSILMMATLVAFTRSLTRKQLLLALAVLVFAVISHRSHFLIVALAAPVAACVALVSDRKHVLVIGGAIAAAAVLGALEIRAYSAAAERATGKAAAIAPYLTARLIEDGPGYAYLLEHCPDPDIPTCALAEALSRSDDPWRLTAAHIAFERSERLGSFNLMSAEDQVRVSADQRSFYLRVLADRPVAVLSAVVMNTFRQTARGSITMTIPDHYMLDFLRERFGPFNAGRLAGDDRSWIVQVDRAHTIVYAMSLGVIAVLCIVPGYATREVKVFAAFVLLGILINAFVCGAVSQPADRYGARVIWLLPFTAALMALLAMRLRTRSPNPTLGLYESSVP